MEDKLPKPEPKNGNAEHPRHVDDNVLDVAKREKASRPIDTGRDIL